MPTDSIHKLAQEAIKQAENTDVATTSLYKWQSTIEKLIMLFNNHETDITQDRALKNYIIETLWLLIENIKSWIRILDKSIDTKYNETKQEKLEKIKQELMVYSQQFRWAKKNLNNTLETWEDIVTINDLQELQKTLEELAKKTFATTKE